VISWGHTDLRACGLVLLVQLLDVLDADPHPRARMALRALAKINAAAIAADRRETIAPRRLFKPEHFDVVLQTLLDVGDTENRLNVFESRHSFSSHVCATRSLREKL